MLWEKKFPYAFVPEYVEMYGIGCSAEYDEMFIIALLFFLFNIFGISI